MDLCQCISKKKLPFIELKEKRLFPYKNNPFIPKVILKFMSLEREAVIGFLRKRITYFEE
jgi:hypothetical protein